LHNAKTAITTVRHCKIGGKVHIFVVSYNLQNGKQADDRRIMPLYRTCLRL